MRIPSAYWKKFPGVSLVLLLLFSWLCVFPVPSSPLLVHGSKWEADQASSNPPTVQDFYVNSTYAGSVCQFAFNVTDSTSLHNATFYDNVTYTSNTTISLSGTQAWANFTDTLPDSNCVIAFQLWASNSNSSLFTTTGLRTINVYENDTTQTRYFERYNWTSQGINTYAFNQTLGSAFGTINYTSHNVSDNITAAIQLVDASNGNNITGIICSVSTPAPYPAGNATYTLSATSSLNRQVPFVASTDSMKVLVYFGDYYGAYVAPSTLAGTFITEDLSQMGLRYGVINATYYLQVINAGNGYCSMYFGNNTFPSQVSGIESYYSPAYQPFEYLGSAIATVEAANTWTNIDPYLATILQKNSTSLQSMIDTSSSGLGYYPYTNIVKALQWCAVCDKLWHGNIPSDVQTDIDWILGNYSTYSMVGSLPATGVDSWGTSSFCVEDPFALYGYYYANTSWAQSYNPSVLSQWNVTAAYGQFDAAVNYSTSHPRGGLGMPLWIYNDGTGYSFSNRFYDEDADTIECYLLFDELLNVSDAMNKALYWWSYDVTQHWNSVNGYFQYMPLQQLYECEAGFFLKIIGALKYYYPSLGNWTYVLTDIGNRFLGHEWNSAQWLDSLTNLPTYAVVHAYGHLGYGNNERRLTNTLGAWQALLGAYMALNCTYQDEMADMLEGNQNTQAAWQLLLSPVANLFNTATNGFQFYSGTPWLANNNASAEGEILLFMMGIVPGTTIIAFPLEELKYEYLYDLDPTLLQFNSVTRQITIPINGAGTITFQYGVSPITCNFNQAGVYRVSFSSSWNLITDVTYLSGLPTNRIYYSQIDTPPYNVTINAHCISEDADVNVSLIFDGSPTAYTTPCTFTNLTGTHTFTVPNTDPDGHPFKRWSTLEPTPTMTAWSGGTYMAYYEAPVHDVAVTNVTAYKTVVGKGFELDISVTGADAVGYAEAFNVTVYANATIIDSQNVTLASGNSTTITFTWDTTGFDFGNYTLSAYAWPVPNEADTSNNNCTGGWVIVSIIGDITGPNGWPDGQVNMQDLALVARCFGSTPSSDNWNPNADINGDNTVNMRDIALVCRQFGQE